MKKFITLSLVLFPLFAGAINHSGSIPYPFYSEDHSGETQIMPLFQGEEALQLRIEMIRRAQKSIEVEYFIYHSDMAGKIFNRELVAAAKRGVKVRLLLDKLAAGVGSFFSHEMEGHGIEVKFYNTNKLFKLGAINFRNHRKLVVVDDVEAIVGGRNLADDYFNLSKKYNFDDIDVFVKGPVVKAMKDSFDAFYDHNISHTVKRRRRPRDPEKQARWDRKVQEMKNYLAESPEEIRFRAELEAIGNAQLEDNNLYPCPVATYVTDAPGKKGNLSRDDYRFGHRNVRKTFLDKILPIDKAITLSSPYFIPNDRNDYIFEELLEKGVDFSLYSNSLRSTDALYMSANLYRKLGKYLKKGMKVFFHDGHFTDVAPTMEIAKGADWGTHSKAHVYETSTYSEIMVGSYNVDNRSDYFNTELALFCKGNDDLSQELKAGIQKLADRGLKVVDQTHALNREGERMGITGSGFFKRLQMILHMPTWLVEHLL